jgi:hypothetical protein
MVPSANSTKIFRILLEKVRSGDTVSAAEFKAIFLPGLCVLLRFRVSQAEIEERARQILEAALARIIATVPPVTPAELPGLICDVMHQLAPESRGARHSPAVDAKRVDRISKSLLRTTREEREILQRYYVHGWTVPQIAAALQLDEFVIRELIARLGKESRSAAGDG